MILLNVLYIVILTMLLSLVTLWFSTIKYIIKNKKEEKQYLQLEQGIIEGIADIYIENTNTEHLKKLKSLIQCHDIDFWDSAIVFIKTNRIIRFTKNKNFKYIFNSLGVEKTLKEKITVDDWYVRAKAIWMTYEFGINDNAKLIAPFRDDEITLVRRESQIALVTFLGWKSLIFFPYITKPMSLWQQIRIIEKLYEAEENLDVSHFEKALKSENIIVIELLVRIIKKFKLHKYRYYVVKQLFSNNNNLIEVAIDTLSEFTANSIELKQIEERLTHVTNTIQHRLVKNYLHINRIHV